jgi:hypothetical protein
MDIEDVRDGIAKYLCDDIQAVDCQGMDYAELVGRSEKLMGLYSNAVQEYCNRRVKLFQAMAEGILSIKIDHFDTTIKEAISFYLEGLSKKEPLEIEEFIANLKSMNLFQFLEFVRNYEGVKS